MRVTVLEEIPEDPGLVADWNHLAEQMEPPEVFFTHAWALAVSRAYRATLQPLLFLVHDAERLCGVAALAAGRAAPRKAFFLAGSTADYCDVLSAPAVRADVLHAVLEEAKRRAFSEIVLANLPSNSATFGELPRVAQVCGYYFTSRAAYECGLVQLGSERERQDLLQKRLRGARQQRELKKLAKLGSVQVTHLTSPDEVRGRLDSIVSAHVLRFLASGRVSALVESERRAFLRELSEGLARAGWLKVSQLEVNGEPMAWNYGFRFGESWFWYLGTFQVEREDLSPGSCLLRLLVEEGCADLSLGRIDLGLGDEPYKQSFVNAGRQTSYVQLSSTLPRHAVSIGRQGVTRSATRFPRAAEQLRRLRDQGVRASAGQMARNASRWMVSRQEVLVFEFPQSEQPEPTPSAGSEHVLAPLTGDDLAQAAIQNPDDTPTLHYLMRCARRLHHGETRGYALKDHAGRAVHLLWVANLDGFPLADIGYRFTAPAAKRDSAGAMIFDSWTPTAVRGNDHDTAALRAAATELKSNGRDVWIAMDSRNVSLLRAVSKAGFAYRYSLVCNRRFGHSTVTRRDTTDAIQ